MSKPERITGLSTNDLRRLVRACNTEQRHVNVMSVYFSEMGALGRRLEEEIRLREKEGRE